MEVKNRSSRTTGVVPCWDGPLLGNARDIRDVKDIRDIRGIREYMGYNG